MLQQNKFSQSSYLIETITELCKLQVHNWGNFLLKKSFLGYLWI